MQKSDDINLIEVWKEWNKLIWLTPIAFFTVISVLGATLKYVWSSKDGAPQLPFEPRTIVIYALLISSFFAFICTLVLYKFSVCRAITSACVARCLGDNSIASLFRNKWGFDLSSTWKGYDYLALLVNSSGLFLLFQAIYISTSIKCVDDGVVRFFDFPFVMVSLSISFAFILTRGQIWLAKKEINKYLANQES